MPAKEGLRGGRLALRTQAILAATGEGVARAPDGRVVFVQGAAPDELVEAEVHRESAAFLRAEALRILEASPARVEPPCEHYRVCGGCNLQHVSRDAQLESKVEGVAEALRRIGGVARATYVMEPPWQGAVYGYRARARFAVSAEGRLGFRGRRQRDVVDVERCPVLVPALNEVLSALRAGLAESPRRPAGGGGEVSVLAADGEPQIALSGSLKVRDFGATGLRLRKGADDVIEGRDVAGRILRSARVFTQSNPEGNDAMLLEVRKWLGEKLDAAPAILELYAGSGNFTRVLAEVAGVLRAFESSPVACRLLRSLDLNVCRDVQVFEASAEELLFALDEQGQRPDVDLAFVNPPRDGLSAEVIDSVGQLGPRCVMYVSCAPAAFARDVARLKAHGLSLSRVRAFDLYPQTSHLEIVGLLERAPSFSGRSRATNS